MDSAVLVALVSGVFTLIGSFVGIVTSNRLTAYRMEQLEKKVEQHNNLVERMYALEDRISVQTERVKVLCHRIDDLEKGNDTS